VFHVQSTSSAVLVVSARYLLSNENKKLTWPSSKLSFSLHTQSLISSLYVLGCLFMSYSRYSAPTWIILSLSISLHIGLYASS
jgi:hypothetical protein